MASPPSSSSFKSPNKTMEASNVCNGFRTAPFTQPFSPPRDISFSEEFTAKNQSPNREISSPPSLSKPGFIQQVTLPEPSAPLPAPPHQAFHGMSNIDTSLNGPDDQERIKRAMAAVGAEEITLEAASESVGKTHPSGISQDTTVIARDIRDSRSLEDVLAQGHVLSLALRFFQKGLIWKNKLKADQIKELKAKVAELERKHAESEKLRVEAKELAKERGHMLSNSERELTKTKIYHKITLDAKDKKIADLEGKLKVAKYSGGLWAKDQTLIRHPEAASFFSWIEPTPSKEASKEATIEIVGEDADEVA